MATIRVLVVDDHTTFAELLTGALDRESDLCCVGTARSVADAVGQFESIEPDVVVMDYHLAGGNGLDAADRILARNPHVRVLMLTGNPTQEALERAAAIGICAFLPKDGSLATVLDALRHARRGSIMVDPALLSQLTTGRAIPPPETALLTSRELNVLRLMADGNDVRTNARLLGISESTCRGHVKSILAKLHAHSQLEAVAVATRRGLIGGDADD
ncbi:response regulator [Planctomonas psychrotolerans]|uniref:response regulator n=1 Tax=Planctomonas psychrotolerans TaxID=2528712 RepID=UPI001D0D3B0E|nr:response regulator transcription factor [Planctomonas psychrotolerans]